MELFVEYAAFIVLAVLVLGGIGFLGLSRTDSDAPSTAPASDASGSPVPSGAKHKPP